MGTEDTPALVLCAGYGTRLQPLSLVRAKPAIPVAGEPMVRRIIRSLAAAGTRHVVVNLHYLPASIAQVLGDGTDLGVRVRYSWESPTLLGSAGGPRQALDVLGADEFLILNGDTLTDLSPARVLDAHRAYGGLVTLALIPNTTPDRYGGVCLDADGAVTGFVRRGSRTRSYHFIGVQCVHRDAFASLARGRPAASVGGVYDQVIAEYPGAVRGFVCAAQFWDVGSVTDYLATSRALAAADAAQPQGTEYPDHVVDSIVWDDVVFDPGCHVERCIVTDGVRVPTGMVVRDAIVRRGPQQTVIVDPIRKDQ